MSIVVIASQAGGSWNRKQVLLVIGQSMIPTLSWKPFLPLSSSFPLFTFELPLTRSIHSRALELCGFASHSLAVDEMSRCASVWIAVSIA